VTNWQAGMELTAARLVDSTKADISTYTPAVTNGGTATWTTQTGYYWTIGSLCIFTAYLVLNATGSGASTLTITAPVNIDRTTRQSVLCTLDGLTSISGTGNAVSLTSGSGAVFDRIRTSTGTNVTGAALTPTAGIITIQGWVRSP
jgi:hypothetical protein